MTILRKKMGTCSYCGKGLFLVTAPVVAPAVHHCEPVLSTVQQERATRDLAVESARLSSYRFGARSYLRTL